MATFQVLSSHTRPVTTILDSKALDALIKTQENKVSHLSSHKHFESIDNVPCIRLSLSGLKMSVEPRKTVLESNLCGQEVKRAACLRTGLAQ